MPDFKIISDSACDFTSAQMQDLDVVRVPLTVVLNDVASDDYATDAERHELYEAIRNGAMPSTSAVNPDGWASYMKPILDEGKDVLCLCFSSAMSTTYQSAVIAAQDLIDQYPNRRINVVDTLSAALGQGLLLWYACQRRDAGESLEDVTNWVEENKLKICHWVTVNDLFHLKRGGRISATTAIVGSMLSIKPIIHVNDEGKLMTVSKARGRKAAIDYITAKTAEATDKENDFVGHADCPEEAETVANILKEKYGFKNVHVGYVGAVIGAHTGPGVLVTFFLGEKR